MNEMMIRGNQEYVELVKLTCRPYINVLEVADVLSLPVPPGQVRSGIACRVTYPVRYMVVYMNALQIANAVHNIGATMSDLYMSYNRAVGKWDFSVFYTQLPV